MKDVSKEWVVSRSKHPRLWASLTVLWNVAGCLLVVESWVALTTPQAVGGLIMVVAGTLLGKTGMSATSWRSGVERRQ